jgi:hypothetical protein
VEKKSLKEINFAIIFVRLNIIINNILRGGKLEKNLEL